MMCMTDGFYYWTYRSHPYSDEEFLYDGILPYAPNSHIAHQISDDIIGELNETAVQYDLGVHIITPVNELVKDMNDVEDIQSVSFDSIDIEKLESEARKEITKEDVLEVGDRQEDMNRHQSGEDVDSVVDIDR